LEVVVVLIGFFLALLVVTRPWVWGILECSPELVALLGGVVALQVPQTLLFQQVFEVARGLLRVAFRRVLDSHDCVVWLALAIRTRVVVASPLIPVVVVVVARVLLALAADSIVLGISLVFFISPCSDHVLELGYRTRAAATEIFKGATMVETVLKKVDDLLVGEIDYRGALVEEASHVLA
jgi:hypothetical protein